MGPAEPKITVKQGPSPPGRGWREAPGEGSRWEIQLNTWPRKIVAITLVLVTCGTLIYRTWWLFLAAWITRANKPEPAIYEKAIKYDPNNADYHFVLSQIYNY